MRNADIPDNDPKNPENDKETVEEKIQKIQDKINEQTKKNKQNDPDGPDAPKPDSNAKEKALIAFAICAICIIGAIALPGIGAQFLGVLAGVTGAFGLLKAKEAIFPTTASKVRNAHDKVLDGLLKELKREIDFQKGYNLGLSGAELISGPFKDKRKQAFSTSEIAGYDAGKAKCQENKTKEGVPTAKSIIVAESRPMDPKLEEFNKLLEKNPDAFKQIEKLLERFKDTDGSPKQSPDAGRASKDSQETTRLRSSQSTSDPAQNITDKGVQSPENARPLQLSRPTGGQAVGGGRGRGGPGL
jgi:hypothetical protein